MVSEISTTNIDTPHHIQRDILLYLRQHGPSTYQQLKPDGFEGNAYNYHLRELKRSGLIAHDEERYLLTSVGYLVSDAFSHTTRRLMLRPAYYSTLLVTADDEVLLYEATREPMRYYLGLLCGKLHYGDSFSESIRRETKRRNLTPDYTARALCPISIRYERHGETVLHRPGTLWHVDYRGSRVSCRTERGLSYWLNTKEAQANSQVLPEVTEGLVRLQTGTSEPIDLKWHLG